LLQPADGLRAKVARSAGCEVSRRSDVATQSKREKTDKSSENEGEDTYSTEPVSDGLTRDWPQDAAATIHTADGLRAKVEVKPR